MKRQQRTVGAFVAIPLNNGNFSYARILDKASFAIYDFTTKEKTNDIELIMSKPILFIIAVYDDAITRGRWEKIGKRPLETNLSILPMKYIQDPINPKIFRLYDPNTGEMKKVEESACVGLEEAAVWEPQEVEERIMIMQRGDGNNWVKK